MPAMLLLVPKQELLMQLNPHNSKKSKNNPPLKKQASFKLKKLLQSQLTHLLAMLLLPLKVLQLRQVVMPSAPTTTLT